MAEALNGLGAWPLIVLAAAGTFGMRLSFMALLAHAEMPAWVRRALAYVPPAILAAIIAPQLFPAAAGGGPMLDLPRLLAGAFALGIALATRSTVATVVLGMGMFWGLQAWLG